MRRAKGGANQAEWQVMAYAVRCSLSGHPFDTPAALPPHAGALPRLHLCRLPTLLRAPSSTPRHPLVPPTHWPSLATPSVLQVADTAEGAKQYAYDTAAGMTNAAGQSWDDAMNEAYKRWEVGVWDVGFREVGLQHGWLLYGRPASEQGLPVLGGGFCIEQQAHAERGLPSTWGDAAHQACGRSVALKRGQLAASAAVVHGPSTPPPSTTQLRHTTCFPVPSCSPPRRPARTPGTM